MRAAIVVLLVLADLGAAYSQSPSFSYPVSRKAEVVDDLFKPPRTAGVTAFFLELRYTPKLDAGLSVSFRL